MFDLQVLAFQSRPDARHNAGDRARGQRPDLRGNRRSRAAPSVVAPPQPAGVRWRNSQRSIRIHVELFAQFIARLKPRRRPMGTLLDNSMICTAAASPTAIVTLTRSCRFCYWAAGRGPCRPGRHIARRRHAGGEPAPDDDRPDGRRAKTLRRQHRKTRNRVVVTVVNGRLVCHLHRY